MSGGWCDGNPLQQKLGEYRGQCGNPATFAVRHQDGARDTIIEACGKHLAVQLESYPLPRADARAFIVVPYNPNVSLLT